MKKSFKLSSLIRIGGTVLIIIFGIILIILTIFQSYNNFKKFSKQLINQTIHSKKELIKNSVSQVVSMINSVKNDLETKSFETVKKNVNVAYRVAQNLYLKNKNSLPIKEIQKEIVEAIRYLRFEKNDYFFIVKLNGKVLLNANSPKFEGKNLYNLTDSQGKKILQNMAKIAKEKGEGFYQYYWHKPGDKKNFYKKISYIKLFKPLNFFIGEGVYPDDIEKRIQKSLLQKIASIRFDKEGYIFINKFDGTALISNGKLLTKKIKLWEEFGNNPKREKRVKQIFKMELDAAKSPNGGFIYYEWPKLKNPNKISKKISYIYGIKDWNWIVGAGVYLDDLDHIIKNLKTNINEECYKSIFIITTSIILSILLLIFLTNKFSDFLEAEFLNLNQLFKASIENKKEINVSNIKIKEIKNFAKYLNKVLNENFKIIKKLEKSENKFRTIFEQSSVPMLLLDKDKFIDCNKAAMDMLRATKKEDIFVHPAELSPEFQPDGLKSIEKAKEIIDKLYKTGKSITFKWTHKRLNGEVFPSLINLCLIPYQDKSIIFVTWMDISEIEKLHKEVEREKEKLEITLKSVGDGVISTDVNGKVELMNKVAEDLTGWKLDEAKGKNLSEIFNIINFYSREKVENPVDKVLKSGKIVGLANHTVLISKDGNEYHIADTAAPIKNEKGEVMGVVLVFRDVTEKYRQEQEIIKLEKLESLGILAGGIAHDFKNILTGITGNLSLIKIQLIERSFEIKKLLERIDKIEHSLERAIHLSNQLLTFAKGSELIRETLDLAELIRKTVEFHLSGSKIKSKYYFSEKNLEIIADKGQLSHVFANLTLNAKDAMKRGGIIYITLEKTDSAIINGELIKGEFVKIIFQDEGCGIEKNIINKIFDPFFTTKEHGSGLGLAMVYSIIKRHDGDILVESEPNKGTTFTIFLPIKKNGIKCNEKINSDKKFHISQYIKNVLIIDDDEMILETAKELFNYLGVNCTTANSGENALKILKNYTFDLIITDLTIPGGMGGLEIINEILKIDPEAKVIVSSGYSDDPAMAEYKKYGFKGRLVKPFTIETLKQEIKKIFEIK